MAKFMGANMVSISGREDPGGPHVGPMNFAIWVVIGLIKMDSHLNKPVKRSR